MPLRRPRFRHHAEQLLYDFSEALLHVRVAAGWRFHHLGGPPRVQLEPTEMAVLCLVKNGSPWLPTFIRHYRELGARHIYFLDNGSADDTVERALAHEGVTVYQSDLPFSRYQMAFRRWMLEHLAPGGWGHVCDVDELMEYPFRETLPLPDFLAYLNRHGYAGAVAQVLDMFSSERLAELQGHRDEDLREAYPYYDLADGRERREGKWLRDNDVEHPEITELKGGIRDRVFGTRWATLTKHNLLRMHGDVKPFASGAHFAAGARMADVTLVIRHYKFIGAFEEHTRSGVEKGQYYRASRTYHRYLDVYERSPQLRLHGDTAREYRGTEALLKEGFLVASERYRRWAERRSGERA